MRAIPLALALTACGVQPAAAGLASLEATTHGGEPAVRIAYRAFEGEANGPITGGEITLPDQSTALSFEDEGVRVRAGAGCVNETRSRVRCNPPSGARPVQPRLILGDRDDWVDGAAVGVAGRMRVEAGAGDDMLETSGALFGGAGRDEILAGSLRDLIVPGPGIDQVRDSGGGAVIRARDGEPDVIECGPGPESIFADELDYVTRGPDRHDCSRITRRGLARGVAIAANVSGVDAFRVTIGCPRDAPRPCVGRFEVLDPRAGVIATRPFRARPGGKDFVFDALPRRVEQRLHRVSVIARTRRGGGFLIARSELPVL
jgi:hypothetical protein